jgi:hypothetical protein
VAVRALAIVLLAGALTACGGVREQPAAHDTSLSAYGITVDLPRGWSGRIVVGSHRLPVLHAAHHRLPAGDSDWGDLEQQEGIPGVYLNVQELTRAPAGAGSLPVAFSKSDIRAGDLQNARVYPNELYARRTVIAGGHGYQVTAIFGRKASDSRISEANAVLTTLRLTPSGVTPAGMAHGRILRSRGVSLRLPTGWSGSVTAGTFRATSSHGSRLGPDDVSLRLREFSQSPGPGWASPLPVSLAPSEFVPPGEDSGQLPRGEVESVRYLRAAGRWFQLTAVAGTSPPDSSRLAEANAALATLSVRPGDFYPGTVQPARFRPARGWFTGTSGPAAVKPDGEGTFTWASTIPYRDEANAVPPAKTLRRLPPDGIVINVSLSGPAAERRAALHRPPSLAHVHGVYPWEGQVGTIPLYPVSARVGHRYNVDVWAFFGRRHPTAAERARADAELRRLQLPPWTAATRAQRR